MWWGLVFFAFFPWFQIYKWFACTPKMHNILCIFGLKLPNYQQDFIEVDMGLMTHIEESTPLVQFILMNRFIRFIHRTTHNIRECSNYAGFFSQTIRLMVKSLRKLYHCVRLVTLNTNLYFITTANDPTIFREQKSKIILKIVYIFFMKLLTSGIASYISV